MIDKTYKRKVFNRAASSYEDYCVLQDKISDNLFDRLELINIDPKKLVDLGCGTGKNGIKLNKKYKSGRLVNYDLSDNMLYLAKDKFSGLFSQLTRRSSSVSYVCGDIEQLPFREDSFDLVWTSSALQWCNSLPGTFDEIKRVLKPNGLFIFSTFGPRTLYELKEVNERISGVSKANQFIDMHNIGDLLVSSGFSDPVLDVENFTLTYPSTEKLLLDIGKIGASSGNVNRGKGLRGRGFMESIKKEYELFKHDGIYPATYEVIYGHAWNIERISDYQPIEFVKK